MSYANNGSDSDNRIFTGTQRDCSIESPYCPKCGDLVRWGDRAKHMAAHYPPENIITNKKPRDK